MEEKFINLFKETLENNSQDITLDTKFRDLENWDSLSFLSVLAMIDEEYDVVIEGNDFRRLVTIEDLISEIRKRKG
jgi:acyl carrier protein